MQYESVKQVYSILGRHSLVAKGKWIMGSCPFSYYTHSKGVDNDPSFGITTEDGESHYSCFSCSQHGKLSDLPVELAARMSKDNTPKFNLKALFEFLEDSKPIGYQIPNEYEAPKKKVLKPFAEEWLSTFMSAKQSPIAMKYLQGRGVLGWQVEYYDLRFDTSRKMICFPLRTKDGILAGMRGRAIDPDIKPRFHDYSTHDTSNTDLVLFNENHLDYTKPIVLVEGNFDVLAVGRHYSNVVAPQTVKLGKKQRDTLIYAPEVWVMYDNDKAGLEGFLELRKYLANEVQIGRMVFDPMYKDAGELPDELLRETLNIYVDI